MTKECTIPYGNIIAIDPKYLTKGNSTFHIRETGIFKTKRFITDGNGNELFKYSVLRNGCTLYDRNKVTILKVTIKDNKDKDMFIYNEQGSEVVVLQINRNSKYGERKYTASYVNLSNNRSELIDITYNQFNRCFTLCSNEGIVCTIKKSGKKYSLNVSPSVDYLFMIGITLCFLKLAEIEDLEAFEAVQNEIQPSHYQF